MVNASNDVVERLRKWTGWTKATDLMDEAADELERRGELVEQYRRGFMELREENEKLRAVIDKAIHDN